MTDKDQVLLQRIRFTGKRTGLESVAMKGYGRVSVGEVIEVPSEDADRYVEKLPTRGAPAADFSRVGGEFAVDRSEVAARRHAVRERLDDASEDQLPDEVNVEMAHETHPDRGTVEEYGEVMAAPPENDEPEAVEKKARDKKE